MISLTEIILISAGLCFDTFAVSLSSGICMPPVKRSVFFRIIFILGTVQALFALTGWATGLSLQSLLQKVDHWIAFGMLSYIGIKMVVESLRVKENEKCTDLRRLTVLFTVAVATSIDAVAVGISAAMLDISTQKISVLFLTTFIFTTLSSAVGIRWGRRIAPGLGKRAEMAGGIILIVIGMKILIEHLEYLS